MLQRLTTQTDYLLREAASGLRRNAWMIWSAVSTLAVLLFLLGLGLQFSWQVEDAVSDLGSQLQISVYMKPDVSASTIEPTLKTLVGVEQIVISTREAEWEAMRKELGASQDPASTLGGNPLVDSLRVRIASPDSVAPIAQQIRGLEGVDSVDFGSEAARRLDQIQEAMRWVGIAITGVLAVATVAVITTTIRLVVLSRRKEIEVMQLVGATPLRIALPFIIEGFAFGVAGALLAWAMLEGTGQLVQQKRQELLPFMQWQPATVEPYVLPLILLGTGIGLGVLGSLIAVRRAVR